MKTINLKDINMPDDVIFNSGDEIVLNGTLTGDPDEIIVITQFWREVFSGTVCHISHGYETRNGNKQCDIILDMPGFNKLVIFDPSDVYKFDGIQYVMACLAEKDWPMSHVNWIH